MEWSCECGFCDKEIKDNEEFYYIYAGYLHTTCRSVAEKQLAKNRDWELLTALDCATSRIMTQEYRQKQIEKIKQDETRSQSS